MKVLIAEDEPLAARRLAQEVSRHANIEIIGPFATGAAARQAILETRPDVALIDIQMPGGTGFEAIYGLTPEQMPLVIFTTAYKHYAIPAFQAGAIDYLLKPIDPKALDQALRKARLRLQEQGAVKRNRQLDTLLTLMKSEVAGVSDYENAIWVKSAKQNTKILIPNIEAFEAVRDYVLIHTAGRSHLKRGKISQMEGKLDPSIFLRVHRSFIINLKFVQSVLNQKNGAKTITLESGRDIRVGRTYASSVASQL